MAAALPLLLLGGAALMLGGKKKRRTSTRTPDGGSCAALGPDVHEIKKAEGIACDFDSGAWVEEVDLEAEEEPKGENAGDFETKDEDLASTVDEDVQTSEAISISIDEDDPSKVCEEFLEAIHVDVEAQDEIPINKIAVEQTAMPAMKSVMEDIAKNLGKPIDPESVGPIMVREALSALIPVCEWKYDDTNGTFLYNDGRMIESEIGNDVLFGLMNLSAMLLEEFNAPPEPEVAGPTLGFSEG
jgi:hypothetical protein